MHDSRGVGHARRPRGGGPEASRMRTGRPRRLVPAHDGGVRCDLPWHHSGGLRSRGNRRQLSPARDCGAPADRAGVCRLHAGTRAARWQKIVPLRERRRRGSAPRGCPREQLPARKAGRHTLGNVFAGSQRDPLCRKISRRAAQHPFLLGNNRRPQGDSLDANDTAQVRGRRSFSPGRQAGRRARLADEHRLDDGSVADLRQPVEPLGDGSLAGISGWARLRPVCPGVRRDIARGDPHSRERVARNRFF